MRVYIVVAVVLGLLGVQVWWVLSAPPSAVLNYTTGSSVVEGTVADDPDIRATGMRVPLAVTTINGVVVEGKILVVLPSGSAVAYGDHLSVRGGLEEPQSFETNTGREFDYASYLSARGISAIMSRATLLSSTPGQWSLLGTLFSIKHTFERSLERSINEPQVSLLEGILLGERGGFSQTLLQAFVVVGLIHIVVLSGSNISIVSEAIFRSLSFLPKRALYVVGAGAIVLFALMTGGGAATVRAVLMGGIAILARYMHRTNDALRALVVAAALMVAWNPLVIFDNGFVLSVLATFGLITLAVAIEARLTYVPAWPQFNIRSIVATTLAVEIFILPALLYYSGVLSLVSIPVNALVLPLVPLIMLAGFLTGLLGLVHPLVALLPALVTNALLSLLIWFTNFVASLPFAATTVAAFPAWVAWLVYIPLTFVATWTYARTALQPATN